MQGHIQYIKENNNRLALARRSKAREFEEGWPGAVHRYQSSGASRLIAHSVSDFGSTTLWTRWGGERKKKEGKEG